MQKIKGIVFDLDDTLYPQESFKISGFKAVARWARENFDHDYSAVFDGLSQIMKEKGPSYPRMFNDLVMRLGLDTKIVDQLVKVFREHDPKIQCYPGVQAMLSRLRKSYKTGILTDGVFEVQQRKIHSLGLSNKVDEILCSDSLKLEKPDARLFNWFEQRFEMPGKNLVYIGDNPAKDFSRQDMGDWTAIRVTTGDHAKLNPIHSSDFKFVMSSVLEIESHIN